MQALKKRKDRNKLADYRPYTKQTVFHNAGARYRERLFMAGNQLGKTLAGGMEIAMHLTGRYPKGWEGRRFDRPVNGWAAGVTGESTRDNPQRILVGPPSKEADWGTGAIPGECIVSHSKARGVSDLLDTIVVKHVSGGESILGFKAYEKGREKWQGETLDFVWFDEEPPMDIYSEGLTRTNANMGPIILTFTPLLGMSEVVRMFLSDEQTEAMLKGSDPDEVMGEALGRHVTRMTIEDAEHYTPDQRKAIIASYPKHERDARTKGIPVLGSGRIFPISQEDIEVEAFPIPDHWKHIGGLDFGWDHPTAGVKLAWDVDADIVYVTNAYKQKEATPVIHAAAVKPWGAELPWAWPHDGYQHDKGSGLELRSQYSDQGLLMLPEKATHPDGGNGVEAGLMEMLDRMQTGRFKVFRHLQDWFSEFLLYHRKDGKVVKEFDDLMAATRYALMMLRFAVQIKEEPEEPVVIAHEQGWMG